MAKTETIRARIEPAVKHAAEAVLHELGLSVPEAITLFYQQVVMNQGLPFPVSLPNKTTRNAMRNALAGHDLIEWTNLEELKTGHQ